MWAALSPGEASCSLPREARQSDLLDERGRREPPGPVDPDFGEAAGRGGHQEHRLLSPSCAIGWQLTRCVPWPRRRGDRGWPHPRARAAWLSRVARRHRPGRAYPLAGRDLASAGARARAGHSSRGSGRFLGRPATLWSGPFRELGAFRLLRCVLVPLSPYKRDRFHRLHREAEETGPKNRQNEQNDLARASGTGSRSGAQSSSGEGQRRRS